VGYGKMTRKNGCWNRAHFVERRVVQDGSLTDGKTLTPKVVSIANFSFGSRCEFTKSALGQKDAGCVGCKHKEA
jgi:hypothetical protein